MEKYFEINKNGQNVRCKLYYDKGTPIQKVVLYGHGFAGHRDNTAAQKFADRVLSKYKGIAVMLFNLPCHGDDVKKKLLVEDCLNYMDLALDYIHTELHAQEVYSYATSYGGYVVLKYIAERGNPFVRVALRCPAVNMSFVLTQCIMTGEQLDTVLRGKTAEIGFDRKVEVNRDFLRELRDGDIQKLDYLPYADDLLILHGTEDEVVPFEASQRFAENNVIEFIPVPGADHRFQKPEDMELANKKVLAFFGF